jgi:hypothetical protein
MKRGHIDDGNDSEQPQNKRIKYESNDTTTTQLETIDYHLFSELVPDVILCILEYIQLYISCEYERWLFLVLKQVPFTAQTPTFNETTSFLIRLLYGYFKRSNYKQYYSLYSSVKYGEGNDALYLNDDLCKTLSYVACIPSITSLNVRSEPNNFKWKIAGNHSFDHIKKLTLGSHYPTIGDILLAKCNNVRNLKFGRSSIQSLPSNLSQLRTIRIKRDAYTSFRISYTQLYHQSKYFQEVHILSQSTNSEEDYKILPLFTELQTIYLRIGYPQFPKLNSNITSLTLVGVTTQLQGLEFSSFLQLNKLRKLRLAFTNVIPLICFPAFASNTSLTHLQVGDFTSEQWKYVVENRSIRHLSVSSASYESALFATDHSFFEQLDSLYLGMKVEEDIDLVIAGIQFKCNNLTTLGILKGLIRETDCLFNFPKLSRVEVCFNKMVWTWPASISFYLTRIPHLQKINLSTKCFHGADVIELFKLKSLLYLKVSTHEAMKFELTDQACEIIRECSLRKLRLSMIDGSQYMSLLELTKHIVFVRLNSSVSYTSNK